MRNLLDESDDEWYDDGRYSNDDNTNGYVDVLVPKISGSLSLIGSFTIMAEVIMDHKAGNGSVISRVLFNLSLGDVFSSFAFFLSTWPTPTYAQNVGLWNVGNQATCSAQGFILQVGAMATPMFNVILAWCQYKVITKSAQERQLQRCEKYFYGIVWSYTLVFSIVLLPLGIYNPLYFGCTMASYPNSCTQSWEADDENPPDCIRGDNAFLVLVLVVFVIWINILCVVFLLVRTILAVRRTERRSVTTSFTFRSRRPEEGSQRGGREIFLRTESAILWRTRLMRQHAYRYIGVFLSAYVFLSLHVILVNTFYHPIITLIVEILVSSSMPLQGFLNFLVFSGNRNMRTAPGRILKRMTYGIFRRCCCWKRPYSLRQEFQRSAQRTPNENEGRASQESSSSPTDDPIRNHNLSKSENIWEYTEGETSELNENSVSTNQIKQDNKDADTASIGQLDTADENQQNE